MEKLAVLIGKRLKELRKLRGLNQEDMENFGLNYRYYQKIETGRANVTLATLEKIARALNADPAELFILPLGTSKEQNEIAVMFSEMMKKKDKRALKKLKVFIRDIL